MCWDWKRGGFQMMLPSRWGAIIHNRDIWQWLVASCKRREHRFVENPGGVPLWKWSTLDSPHFFWLVVDLPLWKKYESQWDDYPIYEMENGKSRVSMSSFKLWYFLLIYEMEKKKPCLKTAVLVKKGPSANFSLDPPSGVVERVIPPWMSFFHSWAHSPSVWRKNNAVILTMGHMIQLVLSSGYLT